MRADRLLGMLLLLQARGKMTAQALAAELEVSRRTILRDIEALAAAGLPIYATGGHGGGIVLDERYRAGLAALRQHEVGTLFIGDNTALLRDVGLEEAGTTSVEKLLAVLPAMHRPAVTHLRQRLLIDPAWWYAEAPPPLWSDLQRAVDLDRCLKLGYTRPDGTPGERIVEPYSLVAKSSIWYLVAATPDGMRTYRVNRITAATVLETSFTRAADFDLPTFWRERLEAFQELGSPYVCRLRIPPERLAFVRRIVPGRSTLLATDAASGALTLELALDAPELAEMLVFGLGADAEVLAPPELRASVLATAQGIVATW